MEQKRPLRVGIIGAGFGARVHAPAFLSEGWEVAALCARNPDKAARAAHSAGVQEVVADPLALIRSRDIDAISIATPPKTHHALTLAALDAGKHVLCEKPFAVDAGQAREMCALAGKSGRTVMVAHEYRHTPQWAGIRRLLDDGYIGRFHQCTIELFLDRYVSSKPRPASWMEYRAEGGGVLNVLGSHYGREARRSW